MSRNREDREHIDNYADAMLDRIVQCVKTELAKTMPRVESAIVTDVNQDGTVNVRLPSDEGQGFSRLLNQSGFPLYPGDSVELLLKNGSFSNCWIIAKHQATYQPPTTTQTE